MYFQNYCYFFKPSLAHKTLLNLMLLQTDEALSMSNMNTEAPLHYFAKVKLIYIR